MSQLKMKLKAELNQILSDPTFDNFTVLELRNTLLNSLDDKNLNKSEVRQVAYSQVLWLTKKGHLSKIDASNNRKIRYKKTAIFYSSLKTTSSESSSTDITDATPTMDSHNHIQQNLLEKLQLYKFELLTCLGESDEYKTLYSEFPELKKQLKESYHQTKDHSSKLLGRIKAIESLIQHQDQPCPSYETT